MAEKGSKKYNSKKHEDWVAKNYNGTRSRSSGAAVTNKGDVRTERALFECKYTQSIPANFLKEFEKVADEAWAEGRVPVLCYRFFDPTHKLADADGHINLTIRFTEDDALRSP